MPILPLPPPPPRLHLRFGRPPPPRRLRHLRHLSPAILVKKISDGWNLVIQANCDDTVMSLHERIGMMKGIPVVEQRLIFRRKQLEWEEEKKRKKKRKEE
ncbi:hypothetical protein Tsubulata_051213 [Turnera subulata]|uniref:Ubiquitin-like domain-containing protein n=1 Tax=Turnera subulata TaxID=218843 RepID=A0A9Q0GAJ1_9ROSI|nr:hypothetical protein Tsubulata_051213 [Turnera subulata]